MNLRIASYNISRCETYEDFIPGNDMPRPICIDRTADTLKKIDADFFCLNEAYVDGKKIELQAQPEKIASLTQREHVAFAKGFSFPWGTIGNAIISKYPILETERIPVPAPAEKDRRENETEWYEDRAILRALIEAEGRRITFITTHFGLNGLEHENMVKALTSLIDRTCTPILLAGDFNVLPHADVLQPIYDCLTSAADAANNTDFTFSTFCPDRTIDYIFYSEAFTLLNYKVYPVATSDHFPVYADLILR